MNQDYSSTIMESHFSLGTYGILCDARRKKKFYLLLSGVIYLPQLYYENMVWFGLPRSVWPTNQSKREKSSPGLQRWARHAQFCFACRSFNMIARYCSSVRAKKLQKSEYLYLDTKTNLRMERWEFNCLSIQK